MFYTLFILFFFSMILLIKRFTNYYSIILCLQTLFLDTALFFLLISIAKLGNYHYPDFAIFLPDYSGYLILSRLKISIYTVVRMQNIGFAGFLACLPFFLYHPEYKKNTIAFSIAILILPIFFAVFYDPETKLGLLAFLYSLPQDKRTFYEGLLKVVNVLNYAWISAYLIVPLVRLLYLNVHAKSKQKRKQLFSLFFSLLCLNSLCLFIFILGPMGGTYTSVSVDKLLCFPDSGIMQSYNYSYLPLTALILSNIMLILLLRFRGLDRADFFRNIIASRMAFKPNKNIRNILHTYKNEMLSVNLLARRLAEEEDEERKKYLINRLKDISENSLKNVNKSTQVFKNVNVSSASCNVTECIENALSKAVFGENITVVKNYGAPIYAFCNKYRLESSIENILCNAVEAIRLAGRSAGVINITVEDDFEWVFIKITDNGTGIPKKDLQKIFSAFYSTKATSSNWGIGLNYVFRSVKIMKGFVYAESELNKYTTFTIMLQRGRCTIPQAATTNNTINGE